MKGFIILWAITLVFGLWLCWSNEKTKVETPVEGELRWVEHPAPFDNHYDVYNGDTWTCGVIAISDSNEFKVDWNNKGLIVTGDVTMANSKECRTPVSPVWVELMCTVEGCDGKIESCAGIVLTSYPAQYPHKCSKCGKSRYISGATYPYIDYDQKGFF